jgi:hypothetical protein
VSAPVPRPPAVAPRPLDLTPGLLAALLVLFVYGGLALSIDFPRAAFGFQSDEATYYMMGHSLAADRDLTYRKEDLARVWREFPSGPSGLFLKKGRSGPFHIEMSVKPPFLHVVGRPDPDGSRLYYGKSYLYPLVAAPFVRLFGTNGFLVLHALLLSAGLLAGYLFIAARSPSTVAVLIASAYFLASVAPGYFVWITPELFNLVLVLLAYFCWLYKEVAPPQLPRGLRWLHGPWSDAAALTLLGLAAFSKPPNLLFAVPVLAWMAWRRRWRWVAALGLGLGLLVASLFAINLAITGELNYQGGERNTFYNAFPFLNPTAGFDVGMDRATNTVLTDIVFDPQVFWSRLGWNLVYFFVGRHSGLVPYFFPCVFALACFLWPGARRERWQWLVFAVGVVQILVLVIWIPYNYFGGAGVLGNRYFMNTYGIFLFLLPPIGSTAAALVPWAVGSLFTAPILLNSFSASFSPADHAKHGPLRLLPIEMTLINDLPINTKVDRVRALFGQGPRFQIYFLDDNAYPRDGDAFWLKGNSSADLIFKTPEPVSQLKLTLAAGPFPSEVTIAAGTRRVTASLKPNEVAVVQVPVGTGFPYQGTRAWQVRLSVKGGFVPMFDIGGEDHRYLGVLVKPEMLP